MRWALAVGFAAALMPAARAHDGAEQARPADAAMHNEETGAALPFPVEITLRFSLIDQTGRAVTQADFVGRPMAIFFGYSNCQSICSVTLPRIGAALDLLGDAAAEVATLMITVDPERDTPEMMAEKLPKYHARLVGLTGSKTALAEARATFQVDVKRVAETADGAPIYAHGSFIYLVGRNGVVRAVLPPVLSPERIAALMRKHFSLRINPAAGNGDDPA